MKPFRESAVSIQIRIHPDGNTALLIFCPEQRHEIATQVIDKRMCPLAQKIRAHASAIRCEWFRTVSVTDEYVVGIIRKIRHAEASPLARSWKAHSRRFLRFNEPERYASCSMRPAEHDTTIRPPRSSSGELAQQASSDARFTVQLPQCISPVMAPRGLPVRRWRINPAWGHAGRRSLAWSFGMPQCNLRGYHHPGW